MHKGDAAGFRQILAPGPSLHKSLPVFMSECRASWMMKPRGVAVIGSQCQKAPAFVRDGGHRGRGGLPLLKLQWGHLGLLCICVSSDGHSKIVSDEVEMPREGL